MIKEQYLNAFFIILISLMFYLYFILKGKIEKGIASNESSQSESIQESIQENNDMICIFNMVSSKFKIYNNHKMSFNFLINVHVRGRISKPNKIIIYFDDIFQIKYKSYLNKYLNASQEQTRPIYEI